MILFRRLKYCVYHMKTVYTRDDYTGRMNRHRVRYGKPEWRDQKHIHVFLEDGTDSVGRRWKTICGRFHHEDHPGLFSPAEIGRAIESYLKEPDMCSTCLAWLLRNKEAVLAAERLTKE